MERIATEAPLWGQLLLLVPLGVVLVVAAVTDWRNRKVYNWLTYPAVIVGLVLHTIVFGVGGLTTGLITAVVVLFVGLLILPLGWLGGGDIKLLIAVGATLGPGALFEVFFYSLFVGMLFGLSLSAVNGYLWEMIKRIGAFLKSLVLSATTRTNLTNDVDTDERSYLPFAIPILAGAIFALTDTYLQWPMFMDWMIESFRALSPRG